MLLQPDISANMECVSTFVAEKFLASQRMEEGEISEIFSATIT
jgi:hypothetical protein